MVGGIREILGFQADGGILAVRCAILAGGGGLEEVGSIQLHAGLGGQGLHADARFRAGQPCGVAQTAVRNNIAVVIAAALLQGRVIGVDIAANGLFLGKVHRGACHSNLAPGGDGTGIRFQIGRCSQRQTVPQHAAGSMAVQVKVAVVGNVCHSGGIGGQGVLNHQAGACQAVAHFQLGVAGEAVGAVGAGCGQNQGIVPLKAHVKHGLIKAVQAAVQAVFALVRGNMVFFLIQGEFRAANAVGVAAHHSAQKTGVQLIILHGGVAQHNIHLVALAVRHKQLLDGSAIA